MRALPLTVLVALCLVAASFPLSGLGVASAAPNPVEGDVAVPAEVVLTAGAGRAGELVGVTVVVARSAIASPGERLQLQRRAGGGWVAAGAGLTDASGRWVTTVPVSRVPEENRLRVGVATAGEPEAWTPAVVGLVRAPSRLSIAATRRVVDERTGNVRVRWVADAATAGSAVGVPGTVSLQRRVLRRGKWTRWQHFRTLRTDAAGRARTQVRPRWSHRWRVVAAPTTWTSGATSTTARTTNVPAGKVVKTPKGAPRPRIKLGAQRRAVGKGANVEVRRISGSQWRAMKGTSWRPGCPVGRDDLRVVETNYWAFDGYRRRGQVVVAAVVVDNFRGAFHDLHAAKVPIRSMRPVERFGWSSRLGGANDLRSMAADNTSVFNCRRVVGAPSRRSPHSWGRSLDLNPWENPYRSAWGVLPNSWWSSRSHPDVAWRSSSHRVVRILARNGFRWTYGRSDLHHFDAVPGRASVGSGRLLAPREEAQQRALDRALQRCDDEVCD